MSSISSIAPSHVISHFDERKWVIQIRRTLDEELEDEADIPVSIFSVPKTLMLIDQDSYVPQQVAIGPYHYWRPEMYEMERYKLAAARRMQKHCLQDLKFHDVVQQLIRYEPRIRAHYHKYLTCSGETLAWMMAVDACFLLEFLQIYAVKQDKLLQRISSRMSHLLDISGRKSAHNAILRDLVMLENQIPLFVLRKMLEFQHNSLEEANEKLFSMLMGFSKALYPFKTIDELPPVQEAMERSHLLDFVYNLIVTRFFERHPSEISQTREPTEEEEEATGLRCTNHGKKFLEEVWKILSRLHFVKKILFSRVLKFLTKLPWKILSNLPGVKLLKGPIESLFNLPGNTKEEDKAENEDLSNGKPPLVEEISIPSVSDLSKVCVNFVPTNGGIKSIKFESKTRTFYLPSVSLDVNTEVTLKNLVAYEACNASGPVTFTRYTELMNGIIDTEEDVKILREKGIILNRLKSDEEVMNLWNGMNRSVRLTKARFVDKVIEDVNKYYNGRWKVKFKNLMKAYVFGSWQFLTFLACIMLLLLMALQAFCSVYSCERLLGLKRGES